jgi:uncharacterized protein (TIGR00369 family)
MEGSAQDPHALVERMFGGQPFMELLGVRISSVVAGKVEMRLPYRNDLTQHDGYFHGGVIATLADNAGGAASYTQLPPGKGALTVELKVNLLSPGLGEELVARGEVVRFGQRLIVSRSDVYSVRAGVETHCATCLMTLIVLETPSAKTKLSST